MTAVQIFLIQSPRQLVLTCVTAVCVSLTNSISYPSHEVLPLREVWMPKQRTEAPKQPSQWEDQAKPEEPPVCGVCNTQDLLFALVTAVM